MANMEAVCQSGVILSSAESAATQKAIARLHIKCESGKQLAGRLSGGNQQKLVISKWITRGAQIYLFDEPTRGIDVGAKSEIYRLMRGLANDGVAVLMISSDMEEVIGVSDRVAVMHEGRISGVLERSQCSEENILKLAVGLGNT